MRIRERMENITINVGIEGDVTYKSVMCRRNDGRYYHQSR